MRVSGGHLCKAEAPTEAAAETLAKPQVLTEGLLQTKKYPSVTNVTAPLCFGKAEKKGAFAYLYLLSFFSLTIAKYELEVNLYISA